MRWTGNERAVYWIVGSAAALVYLNSLANGFVFDDLVAIVQNPFVTQPRLILRSFSVDYWHGTSIDLLYRPFVVVTYGLQNYLHGLKPAYFHLVNVVLHVIVSLLLYRMTLRLFGELRLALMTGVLFALHPIHTEAVASIVGRAELLMSLFSLLTILFYLESREAPLPQARRLFHFSMLCYLLACFCKENGITVPALVLLAELAICLHSRNWERFKGQKLRSALVCYATFASLGVMYLLIRLMVLGHVTTAGQNFTVRGSLIGFPWYLQFANALQYFAQYFRLLFYPVRLSSDYSYNQYPAHATIWHWDIGIGVLCLAAMIVVMCLTVRRRPPVFFGIAFFLCAFLPTSNFIIPMIALIAERAMYLPSFGFLLALSCVIDSILRTLEGLRHRLPVQAVGYGCVGLLLVFFSARTVVRNRDWKDEITLFSSAVRACPDCGNCYNCLGDALAQKGDFAEAIAAYDRSLQIMPDHGVFYFRKANALLKWGKLNEAVETYKLAVYYEPQLSDACDELGRIYINDGKFDEALYWCLKAVAIQPEKAVFHYNLGYVFQRKGKPQEALRQYRTAAALNSNEPSYAFNLGLICRELGDLDCAVASLQKAVELSPANEKYWMTLAETLLRKGPPQSATHALEQLIKVSTNANVIAKTREILGQLPNSSRQSP